MTSDRPIITRLHGEPPSARRGALLGLAIATGVLAGIALIVLGVVYGGPWRWAAGAATLALIALIVVPGFVKDKCDNDFEGEMK